MLEMMEMCLMYITLESEEHGSVLEGQSIQNCTNSSKCNIIEVLCTLLFTPLSGSSGCCISIHIRVTHVIAKTLPNVSFNFSSCYIQLNCCMLFMI